MIDNLLPPLFAAAAIGLTYVFCVRPMRQGRGCHLMAGQSRTGRASCDSTADPQKPAPTSATSGTAGTDRTDAEIARLREEIQLLHHELDLRSGDGTVRLTKEGR